MLVPSTSSLTGTEMAIVCDMNVFTLGGYGQGWVWAGVSLKL